MRRELRNLLRNLWLLCLSGALPSCSSDTVTSIELAVSYDDAWQIERFDIDIDGVDTSVAASHTVELWVPDSLASQELNIEVAGMRKNQDGKLERYAFGKTKATPVVSEVVAAQVALTRLPCGAWCSEGESSCNGDSVVTCTNRDDDSCLEWAAPVPCTGGDSCSLGACRSECIDECAAGELRCAGPSGVQQCGNFDSDDCLEWSGVTQCDSDQSCSGGSCVKGCRDECSDGQSSCSGGGVITCSDRNLDGCTEWGPVASCGEGQSCSDGQCIDGCVDECSAGTCEGATLRECGQFDADECLDKSPGTSCNPKDLCIEGLCDPTAGCSTTEKVCQEPPPSECINATTLRSYESVGQCGDGGCQYDYSDMSCANGCDAAKCKSSISCATRGWTLSTIDDVGKVGGYTSLAIDNQDSVHVAYYDYLNLNLKYATNASGTWQDMTLDSSADVGLSTSIAIDAQRKVHVGYNDLSNSDLKYATNATGQWSAQTLDSTGIVGRDTSLALDDQGKVYISYRDFTGHALKYATNASGTWQYKLVDSDGDVGSYTSLAIDGQGNLHISYYDSANEDLKYATNASGTWQSKTLDSTGDIGTYTSLAIDAQDKVHISYYDFTNGDLKYATNASGTWQSKTLDSTENVGEFNSLAIDGQGRIHIAYYERTYGDLKYATNASGTWQYTTLDSESDVGRYASIAIDAQANVHIAYHDYTNRTLEYAVGKCP